MPRGTCETHQREQTSPSLDRDLVSCFVLCLRVSEPVIPSASSPGTWLLSLSPPHALHLPPAEGLLGVPQDAALPRHHLTMPPAPSYTLIHAGKWKGSKSLYNKKGLTKEKL